VKKAPGKKSRVGFAQTRRREKKGNTIEYTCALAGVSGYDGATF